MTLIKTGVALLFSLLAWTLSAAEKTWTGGAEDALFSSSGNWDPAGAPENGDALFFSGSAAVGAVNDIQGLSLSGITVSGSGTVTLQNTGNGFTLAGDITLSGSGALNIDVPVSIDTDVTFNLSGAHLYAYGAISGTGSITVEGGKYFYAKDAVGLTGVTANNGRVYVEKPTFVAPVTLNQRRVDGVSYVALVFQASGTYNIPITIANVDGSGHTLQTASSSVHVTNTAPVTLAPSTYSRWLPTGSITHAGGITLQTPVQAGTMSLVLNGNNVIREVPIAFPNALYFDNGTLRLAVAGNTYSTLNCYTKTLFTDVPFALDPSADVVFGVGYSKSGAIDINGNDQIINRPYLGNLSDLATSSYILTSSSGPATLTCRATASSMFFGSLDGAINLAWEPLSDAYTFTLTGRVSQTSGTLHAKSGTLLLSSDTAFPNLSGLSASDTGTLRVETPNVPAVPLTLSGSAMLSLPEGINLTCITAQIDGTKLPVGVYSTSSSVGGRSFITGAGTLTVLTIPLSETVCTWTGGGADTLFSTPDNWDTPPSFDGSEALLFADAGTVATLDGVFRAGALRFSRSAPFSIVSGQEPSGLEMGLGGITALAPVTSALVTNTLAVPLTLFYGHEFQLASNQTIAITGTVSGGTPTDPLVKTGDGTLRLTGTNTFESPLVISNGFVNVNTGTALGNPTNTITIHRPTSTTSSWNNRGPLYFTDTVATNDRPIIIGPSVSYIGQTYPQGATLVLNGKLTFISAARIDNPGTLLFRGGLDCLTSDPWFQSSGGNVMRFEERPLDLGTRRLAADNSGTFHVSTASNRWGYLAIYSATFLCGAENALPTNSYVTFGASYTQRGTLNLNGFNQQVKYLAYSGSSQASTNMAIRSETPATLTLQGDSNTTRSFVGYFTNAVSLCHRNSGTLALTGPTSASTTTGDLLIETGTVAFRSGAKWTGSTNITVTAGILSIEGGNGDTFGGNSASLNITRLHLTSSSTVNLAEGVTEYVRAGTLDGKHLAPGSYGSTTSAAKYKSSRFTGSGVLHVLYSEAKGTLFFLQ